MVSNDSKMLINLSNLRNLTENILEGDKMIEILTEGLVCDNEFASSFSL